jgi:hypothetical protein
MTIEEFISILSDIPGDYQIEFDFDEPSETFITDIDDDNKIIYLRNE